MKLSELRKRFLAFFEAKGHKIVPSSSLIPSNDPSLLFTNAGMVQFKDLFLGQSNSPFSTASSCQKCLRAGGKHNDLDNVGFTARHHTFFEMLGNFSFGAYFKKEAISYAWEFLTGELKIPADRLWITVHHSDSEARDIWNTQIGIPLERIISCGDKDNFWSMGDTGPCGPCTEIFYDHGPEVPGGPPGSPDAELDRFVEIWNLVFMQYSQAADGSRSLLPNPAVDTGMGLERVAALMQGVVSNYQTALMQSLIKAAAHLTGAKDLNSPSLNVIADHIRSCAFLIAEGISPGREGRSYVLRRIMRRAIRHGHKLGCQDLFFYKLLPSLVKEMGEAYPELKEQEVLISNILKQEEEQFASTLSAGLREFEKIKAKNPNNLVGVDLFKLYDTYGFPAELSAELAAEANMQVDLAGFEKEMQAQKERARSNQKFSDMATVNINLPNYQDNFRGYSSLEVQTKIHALWQNGGSVKDLKANESGIIILEESPFYAEAGGQVGDTGSITTANGVFIVQDTQRQANLRLHMGYVESGTIAINEQAQANINAQDRFNIARNHSATHLLHAALTQVLGDKATQKGSLVDSKRLRFDFSHNQALSYEQIREIELIVNAQIINNHESITQLMPIAEARKLAKVALFEDKYGEMVRILDIGAGFSVELCGGTHVARTGDIGLFRLISDSSVSAGIRRIEGLTAISATEYMQKQEFLLSSSAAQLKSSPDKLPERIQALLQELQEAKINLGSLNSKLLNQEAAELLAQAQEYQENKLIIKQIATNKLRPLWDKINALCPKVIAILANSEGSRGQVIVGIGSGVSSSNSLKANELLQIINSQIEGKGGGKADFAQAGTSKPEKLMLGLESARRFFYE